MMLLSVQLFNLFQSPFIRAHFTLRDDKWAIPEYFTPLPLVISLKSTNALCKMRPKKYFEAKKFSVPERTTAAYSMAIFFFMGSIRENCP